MKKKKELVTPEMLAQIEATISLQERHVHPMNEEERGYTRSSLHNLVYEIRNLQLGPFHSKDIGIGNNPPLDDDLAGIEFEGGAWLAIFEKRYKGPEGQWYTTTRYIVEPKQKPYVLE